MLAIPIPVDRYLPPLVRAANSAGFVGLVFILARSADAPDHHTQLAEHWVSMHDVTGSLIGVLCPSSRVPQRASDAGVPIGRGNYLGVRGLQFMFRERGPDVWQDDDSDGLFQEAFERAFWETAAQDVQIQKAIDKAVAEARGKQHIVADEPPQSPAQLAAAWTKATTESAQYFGIAESELPCLLMMSLQERTSLVVRLRPQLSIYGLLRATISNLGGRPARIASLSSQQVALKSAVAAARRQVKTVECLDANVEAVVAGLDAVDSFDPQLLARCKEALQRAVKTGDPGDAPAALADLHREMPATGDRPPLRHSAVWGLMQQLAGTGHGTLGKKAEAVSRVDVLESQLRQVIDDEKGERAQLELSSAIIAAYKEVFAVPTIRSVPGSSALQGWTVQLVDSAKAPVLTTQVVRG
jgi:hypothetical protein